MTDKKIGPSFYEELVAHGGLIGEHFSWSEDGTLSFFGDTPRDVVSGVEAVYADHDPDKGSWSGYKASAQACLDATDGVAMRCLKAGAAYPDEWKLYTAKLRNVIRAETGDASVALPAMPAYPAGT